MRTLKQIIKNMEQKIAPLDFSEIGGSTLYIIDGFTDKGKRNEISFWIRDLKQLDNLPNQDCNHIILANSKDGKCVACNKIVCEIRNLTE